MRTKKPLSNYRINKAKQRTRALLTRAQFTPVWDTGWWWYADAHQLWNHLAHTRKLSTDKVSQICACLSVGVHWEINKVDTHTLINAYQNNRDIESFNVSTYDSMKRKSWAIMGDETTLKPTALKTYAFYRNMMLDPEPVTIDRWMLRIFFQRPIKSLTTARYRACEQIIRDVASEFNLLPYQAQAIVWEQARIEAVHSFQGGVLYV